MAEPINQRDAVRNLQRYLRRLSFEDNNILAVPIDGIFGSRTAEALSEFQRMSNLPVTGIADKSTWDALFSEFDRLTKEEDRRRTPDFFPRLPNSYESVMGEHHAFIAIVQFMLNELTVIYDTLPLLTISGTMDEATSGAVWEFQQIHGLPERGQINRNTWNRLVEEYNQYAT